MSLPAAAPTPPALDAPEPPLVPGPPVLGHALAFGRDAPALLAACRARYGDVFTLTVAGQRMTFALHPHDHVGILRLQGALSFSDLAHELSARAFGHRRLEGDVAATMERVTAAHLKGPALLALTDVARRRLDAWLDAHLPPRSQPVGLYDLVRRAMFAVGAEAVFGSGGWDDAARADFEALDQRFPLIVAGAPAALLGVAGARRRLSARLRPGRSDASALCQERAATLRHHADADEIGRVELSLLWAAIANTVPAAFWTLAFLATDPDALAQVTAEVRATPEASVDVSGLPGLQSAVSEALRLTSASITLRRAQGATVLPLEGGAVRVRAGDLVCLFPWSMHHDPEIYDDPERYRYDRFLPVDGRSPAFSKGGRRLAVPLMPYGGGVSMCPGRHLANTEILQLVAALLTRFDLQARGDVPAPDRRRAGLGVLPPRGDLAVSLTPRPTGGLR